MKQNYKIYKYEIKLNLFKYLNQLYLFGQILVPIKYVMSKMIPQGIAFDSSFKKTLDRRQADKKTES